MSFDEQKEFYSLARRLKMASIALLHSLAMSVNRLQLVIALVRTSSQPLVTSSVLIAVARTANRNMLQMNYSDGYKSIRFDVQIPRRRQQVSALMKTEMFSVISSVYFQINRVWNLRQKLFFQRHSILRCSDVAFSWTRSSFVAIIDDSPQTMSSFVFRWRHMVLYLSCGGFFQKIRFFRSCDLLNF